MSNKNARILGVRLDTTDTTRLERFEHATNIEGVSLARAALKSALTYFELHGHLSLPLQIIEAPTARYAVKEIIGPADRRATRLNETTHPDPALANAAQAAAQALRKPSKK